MMRVLMNNIVAAIEYDGTMFKGSQKQSKSRTVQGALDESLSKIHKNQVFSEFASRTDSGVHASNQVVKFETNLNINTDDWVQTLNHYLPEDIRVFKCKTTNKDFDVRRDAVEREYTYKIILGNRISPIENKYYEHITENLDLGVLESAKKIFLGEHNFLSFTGRLLPKNANTVREINSIEYDISGRELIIKISAKSFLYQQVRRIVGSIILLMKNKIDLDSINKAFKFPSKGKYNLLVSSKGLYLSNIKYKNILN